MTKNNIYDTATTRLPSVEIQMIARKRSIADGVSQCTSGGL